MTTRISYQKELNSQQYAAVTAADGPSLVIAGAGSGKTRVLVYRTAYLVELGIPPERILLLTFTRRAAQEMLERAAAILDDRCRRVAGGTFHSFANMILRRYGPHVGLPVNFTILDQSDAENAVQMVCQQTGFRKGDKRFPRKQTLLSIISRAANKCVGVDAVLDAEYPHFLEWADAVFQIQQEYTRYKRRMALVDYDDLLVYLRDLLITQEKIGPQITSQYEYLMVDEYQDTNKIQAEIVHGLGRERRNVMVVGDDAQSIYSFRGAHFQNILRFPALFAGTRTFYLEENYRSSQSILDLTNEVIRSAQERFDKVLFTRNKEGALPVYVDTPDENGQSRYIARKIRALREDGVPLEEIAVLFRSGWHSNDLEVELAGQGIPFVKYGGQRFVESAHIKDVMSYLQVAYNPFHELGWTRLLTLLRGIGPRSAARIYQEVVRKQGLQIDVKYFKKNQNLEQLFHLLRRIDIQLMKPQEILAQAVGHYYPLMMILYDDFV
jgi:DNA helicase-2/ATP-dependent DNA helicase PcrA